MQRPHLSRSLTALLALVAFAAVAYGAGMTKRESKVAEVVRAKHFVLVDGSDRKRMEWGDAVKAGGSGVTLCDASQLSRASLCVDPAAVPLLLFGDANGVLRADLVSLPHDETALNLYFASRNVAIALGETPMPGNRSSTSLAVTTPSGVFRSGACVDETSAAWVSLGDLSRRPWATAEALAEGPSYFRLLNGETVRWQFPTSN